jgi:hypothetical protein
MNFEHRKSAAQTLATYLRNVGDTDVFARRPDGPLERLAALGPFDALSDFAGASHWPEPVRRTAGWAGANERRLAVLDEQPAPNPQAYAPLARLLGDHSVTTAPCAARSPRCRPRT